MSTSCLDEVAGTLVVLLGQIYYLEIGGDKGSCFIIIMIILVGFIIISIIGISFLTNNSF